MGTSFYLRLPCRTEPYPARFHKQLRRASLLALSEKWYSWDIVFIFEPVMFGLLLLGLLAPALFSLIDKEIGARQRGPRGRVGAILALTGVVLTGIAGL